MSLLKEVNLFSTVTSSKKCSVQHVREVIVNLFEDFGNSSSPLFGEIMIREKKLHITPDSSNEYDNLLVEQHAEPESYLGKIARCLTGGEKSSWIENKMTSTDLSSKYSLLYGIATGTGTPLSTEAPFLSPWLSFSIPYGTRKSSTSARSSSTKLQLMVIPRK